MRERECDVAGVAAMSDVEASNVIKGWLKEQDQIRPFCVGWPVHRRLEPELTYLGFANVRLSKMETHDVYVLKGKTGTSGCGSQADLKQIFQKLARNIGFRFRAGDTALSFSRGRFQVVLCLADESVPTAVVADADEPDEGDAYG